ncbi:MAG: hypothetical protein AB7E26_04020 [Chryseobacterium sp.]|nr:hypothetical protein [Chryseobacterium taeanense]
MKVLYDLKSNCMMFTISLLQTTNKQHKEIQPGANKTICKPKTGNS